MKKPILVLMSTLPLLVGAGEVPAITPDSVRAHVTFLADDALEGRDTGSRGHQKAADYVVAQFRAIGLKPAVKGEWFQRVPFAAARLDASMSSFFVGSAKKGEAFTVSKDVIVHAGQTAGTDEFESRVVFAGYGIDDPANGQEDYAGLNVKGKFVAVLSGAPKGMASEQGAHYGRSKSIMAQKRGAIGVLTIRTRERNRTRTWERELEGLRHPSLSWQDADGHLHVDAPGIKATAILGNSAADSLFIGAPVAFEKILEEADKVGGRPKGFALKQRIQISRTTTMSELASPNVVGVLPGSDPALAGEFVLVMAHLDHIGVDESRTGDKIYNGALDNASGIAAMLEAARALAANPERPKRSILFAAVTAEEKGLLGADYLAHNPIVPDGGKVAAVVNLDMPVLLYDFQDVVAFGAEHSTLGPIVSKAATAAGVSLSPDPLPSEGLFTRSDHYMFVRKGIPSVFLMTGFKNGGDKQFSDFLKTHYHKVSDDLKLPINWEAAAKFARVNAQIAAEIANAPSAPLWYADSFFGSTFAPDQPKFDGPH